MAPSGGEARLTAVLNNSGRLSLYLQRGARGSLLHVEMTEENARQLYNLLQAQFDGPAQQPRGKKKPGRAK
jgi:hypothetical protein